MARTPNPKFHAVWRSICIPPSPAANPLGIPDAYLATRRANIGGNTARAHLSGKDDALVRAALLQLAPGCRRFLTRIIREEDLKILSFVTRLIQRRREAGTLAPKPHGGGRQPALDFPKRVRLARLISEQPDATLKGMPSSKSVAVDPPQPRRRAAMIA